MVVKIICPSMGRPDYKVLIGFCSTLVLCLLLLCVLYFTPDGRVLPFGECKLPGPSSSPQDIKQAITTEELKSFLERERNSSMVTSSGTQQQSPQVEVLEEWQLPEVAGDRPHEKLEGPEAFGEPRRFMPLGSGSFLFVQFGAYRTGPNAFAVVGLGTKGLHKYGNPGFDCAWVSDGQDNATVKGWTNKRLPDWNLGNQYSVIVVHCNFGSDVGIDGSGGRLEFVANHGNKDHTGKDDMRVLSN